MIPAAYITDWERRAPWPTREQIEQDLALSRLIVQIANDDHLGEELVFRGGTCLHKLHLPTPLRYSEDLDYVRTTAGGVGAIIDAVRQIGDSLGMRVDTRVTTHPKIRLRAPFETGTGTMRIKVEINTFERSPARPLQRIPYSIDSPWFNGGSDVPAPHCPKMPSDQGTCARRGRRNLGVPFPQHPSSDRKVPGQ